MLKPRDLFDLMLQIVHATQTVVQLLLDFVHFVVGNDVRRSRRRWWRCLRHQSIRRTAAARTISIDDRQIRCFFGKFSRIVYDRRSLDFDAFSFEHVLLSGQGALSVRFTWNIRYSIALSVQFCIGIGLGYARTYRVKQSTKKTYKYILVQTIV